jgi:hypothetical protein
MKLQLNDAVSGRPMVVDTDLIRLVEPGDIVANPNGSHIVFDGGMGRAVKESYAEIAAAIGVVSPSVAAAALVKVSKKKS